MAKPEKFVFVCVNQRPEGHPRGSCSMRGSHDTITRFAELLESEGLTDRIRLCQSGCLGPCFEGPIVAVFPDNVWYREVTPKGAEEIVKEHLMGGNPVERLLLPDRDWS